MQIAYTKSGTASHLTRDGQRTLCGRAVHRTEEGTRAVCYRCTQMIQALAEVDWDELAEHYIGLEAEQDS